MTINPNIKVVSLCTSFRDIKFEGESSSRDCDYVCGANVILTNIGSVLMKGLSGDSDVAFGTSMLRHRVEDEL